MKHTIKKQRTNPQKRSDKNEIKKIKYNEMNKKTQINKQRRKWLRSRIILYMYMLDVRLDWLR